MIYIPLHVEMLAIKNTNAANNLYFFKTVRNMMNMSIVLLSKK